MGSVVDDFSGKRRLARIFLLSVVLLVMLPTLSGSVSKKQFVSYIEKFTMGSIDWDKGLIYGIGRVYMGEGKKLKLKAQGAAGVLASGNIAKLAAGLRLDDKRTLESLGKEKITFKIDGFIRDREVSKVVKQDNGRAYYEIIRVASLKGIEGLTAKIISTTGDSVDWLPPPGRHSNKALDDEDEPWLIIDARSAPPWRKVKPALFPKIIIQGGEVIYGVRLVDQNGLIQRGMASYVTSGGLRTGLEPLESLESVLAKVSDILAVREVVAATKRQRQKRQRFVLVNAKDVRGLQRTNLVISARDAKALKAEDAASRILKNCRVIIVMSSPVGGIEGAILKIIRSWS